ncbi:hypothetical protein GCM10008957_33200 [Deinococcus ruber]|uniref:Uncharacterized protein n=1 Tax=Deinococcus ruber TaxID=1848197 RepID=A0A918CEY9_9DEIO|nr:hypothetical protein GCM10008957_33200 [Deinococcus ruber]
MIYADLNVDDLRRRFNPAAHHRERTRWHGLLLSAQEPRVCSEVVCSVQRGRSWLTTPSTLANIQNIPKRSAAFGQSVAHAAHRLEQAGAAARLQLAPRRR